MPEEKVQNLPLAKVHISERNSRQPKAADPDVIELAQSIEERGQTTPAIGRPHPKQKGHIELGAGARRRMGCEVAGQATIAVIVREMSDDELDDLILVENLQRVDPDPRAEADVLARMVSRGLRTNAQIAAHLGKPEAWVARRMKLTKVIPELLKLWQPEKRFERFTVEMMELLGSLPIEVQKDIAKNPWELTNCKSRRDVEARMAKEMRRLDQAPFNLDDPRYFNKANNCGPGCASDSSKEKDLFDFTDGENKKKPKSCARCLNSGCFNQRLALWRSDRYKELCGAEKALTIYSQHRGELLIGKKAVSPQWDYYSEPVFKEPKTGGQKVVFIPQHGMGMQIAWITKRARSTSETDKGKPRTEAQKRKDGINLLQGKRWLAVHEKLVLAVKAAELKSLTVPIDDLIATFGLPFHITACAGGPDSRSMQWKLLDNRDKGYPAYKANDYPPRDPKRILPRSESLWPAMQVVLLGLIPKPFKVGDAASFAPMYERIAQLIQFDIAAAKHAADLAILPPKSWGKVDPHTLTPIK